MNNTKIFIFALILIFSYSQTVQVQCLSDQIYTQQAGCILSCKSEAYSNCGDVFTDLYQPMFCALKIDGSWESYTYDCQACQNPDVIGVAEGSCSEIFPQFIVISPYPLDPIATDKQKINECGHILCSQQSICKKGKCVSTCKHCRAYQFCMNGLCLDKCAYMRCANGCKHGKCLSKQKTMPLCKNNLDCWDQQTCNKGICQNFCLTIKCAGGYYCQHGKCVEDKCNKVKCKKGFICSQGKCQKIPNICPADSNSRLKFCPTPRSDQQTCPTLYYDYIIAPISSICGITSSGQRIDFYRSCQACMNKDIAYYFEQPCHSAPFVCQKNENCLDYYCASQGCRSDEECPYDWQICYENQCIDRCALLKCASCKFGQCLYEVANGDCNLEYAQCSRDNWICNGFECVDLCERKACKANQVCKQGICYQK